MKTAEQKLIQVRKRAVRFLQYYIACGFSKKQFKGDYRAGGMGFDFGYHACFGGLFTTTPEKPAQRLLIKNWSNKTVAEFLVDELWPEDVALQKVHPYNPRKGSNAV